MNNIAAKVVVCVIGLVGTLRIHGRARADGSTALLLEALDSPTPYILPGTDSILTSTFTGFKPLDYILRLLVLFWWETLDGSHPDTSAIGLYFLGQLLPCIVIVYLDALRGEKPSLVKSGSSLYQRSILTLYILTTSLYSGLHSGFSSFRSAPLGQPASFGPSCISYHLRLSGLRYPQTP